MADRDKVMKGLESCIKSKYENCPKDCPFFADCYTYDSKCYPIYPVIEAAFSLVSLLEPKSVLNVENYAVSGFAVGKCPTCKEKLLNAKDNPARFCKFCGQAVKWDEGTHNCSAG